MSRESKPLQRATRNKEEAKYKPNIVVCEDQYNEQVLLDEYGVFREVDLVSPDSVRALGFTICNEPNPPTKIGDLSNVEAEIAYHNLEQPNDEPYFRPIRQCCWTDEEWPSVSLGINEEQTLILVILDDCLRVGYPENRRMRDKPTRQIFTDLKRVRIKVKLTGGENKEWGPRRLEYDLIIENERQFQFKRIC